MSFAEFLRTPFYRTHLDDCYWSNTLKQLSSDVERQFMSDEFAIILQNSNNFDILEFLLFHKDNSVLKYLLVFWCRWILDTWCSFFNSLWTLLEAFYWQSICFIGDAFRVLPCTHYQTIICKQFFLLQAHFLQISLKLTWANSNWQYLNIAMKYLQQNCKLQ